MANVTTGVYPVYQMEFKIGTWNIVQCALPYDTPVNMQPLPDNGMEYHIEVMITYRKGE